MSDLDRDDVKRQITELLQGMTILLDSNRRMGEKLENTRRDLSATKDNLSMANKKIDALQSEITYLMGKQNAHKRRGYGGKSLKEEEEETILTVSSKGIKTSS